MIRLSPRLAAVAAMVPRGARVADVGTDHGLLAVYLAEQGIAASVVATDVRPGPLAAAKENIEACGLAGRIELRLCDGLADVQPEEADVIVIAGMGGETIAGILSRAPWALENDRRLLISPQSKQELLRAWLWEHGCAIREERLVRDAGRIYPILCAGGKASGIPGAAELYMGVWPAEARSALFYEALRGNIERLRREADGLRGAQDPEAAPRLRKTEALLAALREWEV